MWVDLVCMCLCVKVRAAMSQLDLAVYSERKLSCQKSKVKIYSKQREQK